MRRVRLTARSVRRALVVGAFGWACSASGCSHKATVPSSVHGASASEEAALRDRLRAAWMAKGPDYVPRTRHKNPDGSPKYTNRLILESSPYLLQHAHNPVDWYPWGDEAFAAAKAKGRPVFLSVGYSTCHWCHVMEEESFEDEAIAAYINEHYIPIKVDREERPDIDAVYMGFVQALTGGGGWPMNVWLTPGREPFFGGTYFAPRAGVRGARRGFLDVLRELSQRFQDQGAEVASEAAAFSERLRASVAPAPAGDFPSPSVLDHAFDRASARFDATFGGARGAPKFPASFPVRMLLRYPRRMKNTSALRMATETLSGMDAGGLHDAIGGGFHRYSTDARWLVPHFEKMLYDNALLAVAYLEAAEATGDGRFLITAESTLDYLLRDMKAPDGTFYAATDADSPGPGGKREEGLYFTWTPAELEQALGADDARVAEAWFAVSAAGNFEGRTVLSTPRSSADVARELAIPVKQLESRIADIRKKLLEARARRKSPDRDEKVIVAWNALAVSALARAAIALGEPRYADAAIQAATALIAEPRAKRPLPHVLIGGHPKGKGFADDHVLLAAALLDVFELTSDVAWLDDATALMEEVEHSFRDPVQGGYFLTSAEHETLLTRDKPDDDGPVPSASSVAALTWLRLYALTSDERYHARAETTLRAFSRELEDRPLGQEHMLLAVDWASDSPKEIVVVVPEGRGVLAPSARPLLAVLAHSFVPNASLLVATESDLAGVLGKRIPSASGKRLRDGHATAYVCQGTTCQLPTHDPELFARQLTDTRSSL